MDRYRECLEELRQNTRQWTLTGAAGFIGSNILQTLLELDQKVVALDNFATGHRHNLEAVQEKVGPTRWEGLRFVEGDIRDGQVCQDVCRDSDFVLHQAALGSVPRSVDHPLESHEVNITGFLNMLIAARDQKCRNFVYAASSSTYGDEMSLPKVEDKIGNPLSPYAVTKYANELYAQVFNTNYGLDTIGLRYFNVFGPRQDPRGAYAAVIPLWVMSFLENKPIYINGDGETSRDFCFIGNVVRANIMSALASEQGRNQVYNIAVGEQTTLNQLYHMIGEGLGRRGKGRAGAKPVYRDFRDGDVRHSLADISKAKRLLGYEAVTRVGDGLEQSLDWYVENLR